MFYQNEKTGKPAMPPLWVEFPTETNLFGIDTWWEADYGRWGH
jgi:hypothetical protein